MVKWGFVGCKSQGLIILRTLAKHHYLPDFIVTLPNMPSDETLAFKNFSTENKIMFYELETLDCLKHELKKIHFLLVCRFNLLPKEIFTLPIWQAINIHCSLLPAYPGIHPIQWSMIKGEKETGVTLHLIDEKIDHGEILLQQALTIEPSHTIHTLTAELNLLSSALALSLFDSIRQNERLPRGKRQSERGWYARRRNAEDGRIDWNTHSATDIFNLVRTLQPPYPACYCMKLQEKVSISNCHIPREYPKLSATQTGLVIEEPLTDHYLVHTKDQPILIQTITKLQPGDLLS